jgi:hypothetical protein
MKNKPTKAIEDLELYPLDWRSSTEMLCSNSTKLKIHHEGGSLRLRKLTTCKSQTSPRLTRFTRPLFSKVTRGQKILWIAELHSHAESSMVPALTRHDLSLRGFPH